MPELPEVETTRRGIEPHILNKKILAIEIRQPQLRWPIPDNLRHDLPGLKFTEVQRRGKYLLLECATGTVLIHLGMSGSLRIIDQRNVGASVGKHDHVDILFSGGRSLRYTDPRRFGSILWHAGDVHQHPLLASLGPEPLTEDFHAAYLHSLARGRKQAVKQFIMDSKIVVGVGNIYANEALFTAGIRPNRGAGNISLKRYQLLVKTIKSILAQAIAVGGTTLRDFTSSDGSPGYFRQSLQVYGRGGLPCAGCDTTLKEIRQGQRSSVYCPKCQR